MANAYALSRLPLKTPEMEVPKPPELVCLVEYLDSTPLTSSQIRVWTDHDPALSKVKKWVNGGGQLKLNKIQICKRTISGEMS